MNIHDFETLLHRLADGWSSCEYDSVAEQFADPLFYSDGLNYTFYDKASLLAFFREDGGHEQICVFHSSIFDAERQIGVAEYTYSGHFTYHGTVWIDLDGDRISVWREYQYRADTPYPIFWKLDEKGHH